MNAGRDRKIWETSGGVGSLSTRAHGAWWSILFTVLAAQAVGHDIQLNLTYETVQNGVLVQPSWLGQNEIEGLNGITVPVCVTLGLLGDIACIDIPDQGAVFAIEDVEEKIVHFKVAWEGGRGGPHISVRFGGTQIFDRGKGNILTADMEGMKRHATRTALLPENSSPAEIAVVWPLNDTVIPAAEKRIVFNTRGFKVSAEQPLEIRMPENDDFVRYFEQDLSEIILRGGTIGSHLVNLASHLHPERVETAVFFSTILTPEEIRLRRFLVPPCPGYDVDDVNGAVYNNVEKGTRWTTRTSDRRERTGSKAPHLKLNFSPGADFGAKTNEGMEQSAGVTIQAKTNEHLKDPIGAGAHRQPIRLCFVGSWKAGIDGQKEIWLQEMERLPQDRFSATYLTFQAEEDLPGNKGPAEKAAPPTTTASQLALEQRLRAAGVRVIRAPIPPVSLAEIEAGRTACGGENYRGGGGVCDGSSSSGSSGAVEGSEPQQQPHPPDPEALFRAILESLDRAGSKLALMHPPWARRVLEHIIGALGKARPDVLVLGNTRSLGDAVLTRAARLMVPRGDGNGGHSHLRVVVELPNIDPHPEIDADLLVAPSHYVARHEGTQALAREVGAGVVVIPPGVDMRSLLHPADAEARLQGRGEFPTKRTGWGVGPGGGSCSTTNASGDGAGDEYGVSAGGRGVDVSGAARGRGKGVPPPPQPLPPPPRKVCHPSCGPIKLATEGCNPVCQVVGYVGRMAPEKGPGLFLLVAREVATRLPFTRFVMVGDGPLKPALEDMAERLGIARLVHFTGWASGDELQGHFSGMDLFLNPSLAEETFAMANIEAMATGTPVLAFGVGGMLEYLSHGSNGVVLDDPRPAAVAREVAGLLEDPGLRARLGQQAKEDILHGFRAETMVQRWANVYESLVQQ